ncbi:alkylmercury lyase family protein [Streptomyces diastaticus]|uniref:organomercurial lyase n=2 Tax=Streptomyces TaxID=1883 RepID=UPI00036CE025|nr:MULTISPECIES: alkylmercury lyase family protein [Streptomyces]KOU70339.1 alkylmercury lyase [Streptomyces sp. XY66]WUB68506.1 alkylmercury lyase family protein [Streptomyces sp. NBC_00582]
MRITVLTVPGCPNAAPAAERVRAVLAGREAQLDLVEVHDLAQAAECGMTGSPTILVDGVDPFASEGVEPSMSCRLYRGADGTVSGVPGEAALCQALTGPRLAASDCCETYGLDAVGRAGRGRRAPGERGLRAVHQAVLRHFAATGGPPDPAALEPLAAEAGRTAGEILQELAGEDFLTLDGHGRIHAAYPFSAAPTRHRVKISAGAEVWSMCAIDALGIPAMLGRDVVISSTDPVTGEPVTLTTAGEATVWRPASAVVFIGQRPGGGPAATACCDALNFFTSDHNAGAWAREHPEVPGHVISQQRAAQIAAQTFAGLLDA